MITPLTVGINVKAFREKRNFKQGDLAKATGFTQSKISKIENGNVNLTLSEIVALCNALKIGVEKILSVKEEGFIMTNGEEHQLVERYRNAPDNDKQIIKLMLNIFDDKVDDDITELMRVCKNLDKKYRPFILDGVKKALEKSHEEQMVNIDNKLKSFNQ